jgi:hypothetical protein
MVSVSFNPDRMEFLISFTPGGDVSEDIAKNNNKQRNPESRSVTNTNGYFQ